MGVAIHKVNKEFFYKDSKELWYFYGFVAADGYVSDNRLIIAINNKDRHLLETFSKWIQPTKKLYYREETDSCRFVIDCKELMSIIKNIMGMKKGNHKKTDQLRFPVVPDEFLKDFILGYADGDGCITKCSGQKKFPKLGIKRYYRGIEFKILGNENFIKDLIIYINKIYPNKTKTYKKRKNENVYLVSYNFSTARGILDILYKDKHTYLYRKYKKYEELKNTVHEDIVYSEPKG